MDHFSDLVREREAQILEVRRIGKAIDENPEQAQSARAERKLIAKIQSRRSLGIKPRAEYRKSSKSALKPWEAEGICRRAWEKRRRKAQTITPHSRQNERESQMIKSQRPDENRSFLGRIIGRIGQEAEG
jgi:hypothetical protein